MSTHHGSGGRERACMDRCEVCQRVIEQRPDPGRRRCGDHLAQLELVPTNQLARTTKKPRRVAGSPSEGEGSR